MKFSLHSVHGGVKNIDEIHKRAVRVEELGYDGIFLGESHLNSIDSFQTLASCAMITKRVLLGIAVTNMVFRHQRCSPAPPRRLMKSPKAAQFLVWVPAMAPFIIKNSKRRR